MKPTVETLNSDDPAIRLAFYRTFDPENRAFRDLDWAEWLERDESCYLYLDRNSKIWRSSRGRSKLSRLVWHGSRKNHDLMFVGFFKEREEEYRHTNPEWFQDEEEPRFAESEEPECDRVGDLERSIRELVDAFAKRRSTDAKWFLVAALIGSFIGATIW
jgi:hypothetical protein